MVSITRLVHFRVRLAPEEATNPSSSLQVPANFSKPALRLELSEGWAMAQMTPSQVIPHA
jgi:hypothetical protein